MLAYFEYLGAQMDTDGFIAAARVLWATSRFFPRPVDFVLAGTAGEWPTVVRAVEEYTPPRADWLEHWEQLSDRSRAACHRLGGLAAMRKAYERDTLRLKAEWERAYEQEISAEVLALPSPGQRKQIAAAKEEDREDDRPRMVLPKVHVQSIP